MAMTTTLKVKEVDLSPGDAETTPTQVCRAQHALQEYYRNNKMKCKVVVNIEWKWFCGEVEQTWSKPNLSVLSPWLYLNNSPSEPVRLPSLRFTHCYSLFDCVLVCQSFALPELVGLVWFGLVHSFVVKLPSMKWSQFLNFLAQTKCWNNLNLYIFINPAQTLPLFYV